MSAASYDSVLDSAINAVAWAWLVVFVALLFVLLVLATLWLRTRCTLGKKDGIGLIHVHEWPYWHSTRASAWFIPEGTDTQHRIPPWRVLEILDLTKRPECSKETIMAIIRRPLDADRPGKSSPDSAGSSDVAR